MCHGQIQYASHEAQNVNYSLTAQLLLWIHKLAAQKLRTTKPQPLCVSCALHTHLYMFPFQTAHRCCFDIPTASLRHILTGASEGCAGRIAPQQWRAFWPPYLKYFRLMFWVEVNLRSCLRPTVFISATERHRASSHILGRITSSRVATISAYWHVLPQRKLTTCSEMHEA